MSKISIPIGPQHPLIKEPVSFVVDISGERVLGGSLRLGYVHRGIERLAQKRTYIQNVHLIERICGICSHVHTTAYCTAVERLAGVAAPERAQYIRVLMCELERIHSHLLWLGILAKHVGLETIFMHTWHDREMVLDLMEEISGGRVTHAVNKIGGVRCDITATHADKLFLTLQKMRVQIDKLLEVMLHEPSLKARTQGVAPISAEQIKAFCVVGPIARASGVDVDMRRDDPLPPYDRLAVSVVTREEGDAWARTILRVQETKVSIDLCKTILQNMPAGALEMRVGRKVPAGEVIVRAEAPRGELFYYLRSDGTEYPARLKIRTPTLPALSVLPTQLSSIQVADIPVIFAGVDLCIACADR